MMSDRLHASVDLGEEGPTCRDTRREKTDRRSADRMSWAGARSDEGFSLGHRAPRPRKSEVASASRVRARSGCDSKIAQSDLVPGEQPQRQTARRGTTRTPVLSPERG